MNFDSTMNLLTVLVCMIAVVVFIYSQYTKYDFLKEWTQFADEHQFDFDARKSSLTARYRNCEVWIGPEQYGIPYTRAEQNSKAAFDTAIRFTLRNPGRLRLRGVTKLTLKGENEFTTLLADSPQVINAFAELKTSWSIRIEYDILKYTQQGVEHDTTRLFSTPTVLANLVDVIEALPVLEIEIDPLLQYPGYL